MLNLQLDPSEVEQVTDALNVRIGELKAELDFIHEKMSSVRTDSDFESWAGMAVMRMDHVHLLQGVLRKLGVCHA